MGAISQEEVISTEEKLLKSITENDTDVLEDLLHDDLLFHLPNGQVVTKSLDLDAHRSGNLKVSSIAPSDYIIKIIEDTAVVSVLVELKGSFLHQPIDGSFRYVRVWKLFAGKLKIIAGSCIQLE